MPSRAVDITRDLNRDGRDDLIFPDVDGFWIATQLSHGGFTGFTRLGPPEPFRDEIGLGDSRVYGEMGISAVTVPRYLSRVHGMDYNHDGRSDLVFFRGVDGAYSGSPAAIRKIRPAFSPFNGGVFSPRC